MLTARSVALDVDSEKSAVHAACEAGEITQVRAALLEGEKSANAFYDGHTPLHATILSGNPQACDVIQLLLEHGADINAQTRGDEDTALHLVVENGDFPNDFALVLMLLENDVDLSVRNRKLRTAYDCAMGMGHYELASTLEGSMPPEQARDFYMLKVGEKYGPYIIAAVLRSDENMLHDNIQRGGNPNVLNKHGAGAIHYAITHSSLPVMQVLRSLVDAGADVNIRDDEGDTALNLAIKSKRLRQSGEMIPVVTFLVDNGSDSSIQDLDGKDAFMLAEGRGYDDVLQILRGSRNKGKGPQPKRPEEFPDPNAPNEDGLYPIHVATSRTNAGERYDLIESLLERGARVSQQDEKDGNTALHLCAQQDLGDTAEQLLDHHIDYTARNKEGKTAYDIAKEQDHTSVLAAIEKKEQKVRDKWKKGKKAGWCVIL